MATTITTPQSAPVLLAAGDTLYVTGQGIGTFGAGPQYGQVSGISGSKTFGPFPEARTINLCASATDLSYWTDSPDIPGQEPILRDRASGAITDTAGLAAVRGASIVLVGSIVLLGHSKHDQYTQANGATASGTNYFTWFQALNNHPFKVLGKFALSGTKTDALDGQVTQTLALSQAPQYASIYSGVNDYGTYTPTQAAANIRTAARRLLNYGITPIVVLEDGTAGQTGASYLTWLFELQERIRSICEADRRIWMFDPTPTLWDPAGANWTSGSPTVAYRSGYVWDNTHTSVSGAYNLGVAFGAWIAGRVVGFEARAASLVDSINASNPLALIANGMFTTTSGGTTNGTGTITGNVPGSWVYSKGASAGTATTFSYGANANGFGNDLTMVVTTTAADVVTLSQDVAATPRGLLNIGDVLQGGAEVVVSAGTNLRGVYLRLDATDGTTLLQYYDLYCGANGDSTGNGPQAVGPLTLENLLLTLSIVPSAWVSLRLFAVFSGAGGATVVVRKAKLRKRITY